MKSRLSCENARETTGKSHLSCRNQHCERRKCMYRLMNTIICVALVCCSALAQTKTAKREVSFEKEKFETTLNAAYEKKDANAVGEQLASIYNEGGVSREMAVRQIQE